MEGSGMAETPKGNAPEPTKEEPEKSPSQGSKP